MPKNPEANREFEFEESADRSELLESIIVRTERIERNGQMFSKMVAHVSEQLTSENFGLESVELLVRYVVELESIGKEETREQLIDWICATIYDDPVAHGQTERLWESVIKGVKNQK